jgi:hypothetical protein
MTHARKFHAADFPRLTEFVRGYLHQDMNLDSGTATNAAVKYLQDLRPDERLQVAEEALRLHQIAQGWTIEEINNELVLLGSDWLASSPSEFLRLLKTLQGTAEP